jgi:hypothetical protein
MSGKMKVALKAGLMEYMMAGPLVVKLDQMKVVLLAMYSVVMMVVKMVDWKVGQLDYSLVARKEI